MDDEFLIDNDDELTEEGYYQQTPEEEDEFGEENDSVVEENTEEAYRASGTVGELELKFLLGYDTINSIAKKDAAKKGLSDNAMLDMLTVIVGSNPQHTNLKTVNDLVRSMLGKDGKNRVVNSVYVPTDPLTSRDVDEEYAGDDTSKFNKEYIEEARTLIANFIEYLANRDLSKDSAFSKRRKLRQIPAFIIFLFSSGLYDLILDCPTMPKEYNDQINNAFQIIMKNKYDIVEQLARAYEAKGRDKIADRVRKMGLSWFEREPAEIRILAAYSDLNITYDDVALYREYRSKFTNTSKSITQDTISDLIEVYQDPEAGIYEKLKDKTRGDAIQDVKQVWKQWVEDNAMDSDLAKKIIWKSI